MSFLEAPSPDEIILSSYAETLNTMLLDEHAMAPAGTEAPVVKIDKTRVDPGGQAPNRPTSIVRHDKNDYILYEAHYKNFEEDFRFVYDCPETPVIARKLFVGLGIVGALINDRFAYNQPSPLKVESHAKQMSDYFADHAPIHEVFREIFNQPDMMEPALMTEGLTDRRAMFINGLRLRFGALFASEAAVDFIGINEEKITRGARRQIRTIYARDAQHYSEAVVFGMGQDPKYADQMIFNALPDWLVAAAAPASMRSVEHLFSDGWKHD